MNEWISRALKFHKNDKVDANEANARILYVFFI